MSHQTPTKAGTSTHQKKSHPLDVMMSMTGSSPLLTGNVTHKGGRASDHGAMVSPPSPKARWRRWKRADVVTYARALVYPFRGDRAASLSGIALLAVFALVVLPTGHRLLFQIALIPAALAVMMCAAGYRPIASRELTDIHATGLFHVSRSAVPDPDGMVTLDPAHCRKQSRMWTRGRLRLPRPAVYFSQAPLDAVASAANGVSTDGTLFVAVDLDAVETRDIWRRHTGEIAITSPVRARVSESPTRR